MTQQEIPQEYREIIEAAKHWRATWPDTRDDFDAQGRKCDCPICRLIRAVDAAAIGTQEPTKERI